MIKLLKKIIVFLLTANLCFEKEKVIEGTLIGIGFTPPWSPFQITKGLVLNIFTTKLRIKFIFKYNKMLLKIAEDSELRKILHQVLRKHYLNRKGYRKLGFLIYKSKLYEKLFVRKREDESE